MRNHHLVVWPMIIDVELVLFNLQGKLICIIQEEEKYSLYYKKFKNRLFVVKTKIYRLLQKQFYMGTYPKINIGS